MTSRPTLKPAALRLLLALALLVGQTFLAYHEPSHIPGSETSPLTETLLVDDCQLGAQAHAPALPPAMAQVLPTGCRSIHARRTAPAQRPAPNRLPQARAPPLSA